MPYSTVCVVATFSGYLYSGVNAATSATVTTSCAAGYFLSNVGSVSVCKACGANAATCTSNYAILSCASGYTLKNTYCYSNSLYNILISSCASGYF